MRQRPNGAMSNHQLHVFWSKVWVLPFCMAMGPEIFFSDGAVVYRSSSFVYAKQKGNHAFTFTSDDNMRVY